MFFSIWSPKFNQGHLKLSVIGPDGHQLHKQNDIPRVFIQTSKTASKLHCYIVTDSRQKCVSSCRSWTITLIPRCGHVNKRTNLTGELPYCHFISSNMGKAYSHVKLAIVKVKSTSLPGILLPKFSLKDGRHVSKIFVHFGADWWLHAFSDTEFSVILPLKDGKHLRFFRIRAGFQKFWCEWTLSLRLRDGCIARVVGKAWKVVWSFWPSHYVTEP